MAKITTLPGLGKSSQELLEVAGFLDVEALAKAGVDDLVDALEKANDILKISNKTPTRSTVQQWVASAREITGTEDASDGDEDDRQMPVNYEGNPEVAKMLESAPCAIPLPGKVMMENRLAVSDVPPAILLNRYSGDLEVRVNNRDESAVRRDATAPAPATAPVVNGSSEIATRPLASGNIQRAEPESRLDIDTSRVKTFEEFSEMPKQRAKSSNQRPKEDVDRIALLRAPLEKTNRGRDPKSRWYIRGVLHTHPFGMALGAFVTLLLIAVLPAAIVSTVLLFIQDQFPGSVPWAPKWLLAFPLALPVCGLLYLFYGLGGKCRICGQRQFWPRHCRKNSKAHHVPGLGYIIPVSLQMLIFKWFRCTYCGTPVRLKK